MSEREPTKYCPREDLTKSGRKAANGFRRPAGARANIEESGKLKGQRSKYENPRGVTDHERLAVRAVDSPADARHPAHARRQTESDRAGAEDAGRQTGSVGIVAGPGGFT